MIAMLVFVIASVSARERVMRAFYKASWWAFAGCCYCSTLDNNELAAAAALGVFSVNFGVFLFYFSCIPQGCDFCCRCRCRCLPFTARAVLHGTFRFWCPIRAYDRQSAIIINATGSKSLLPKYTHQRVSANNVITS